MKVISICCKTTDLPPINYPVSIELSAFDTKDHTFRRFIDIPVTEFLDWINHDKLSEQEIGVVRRFGFDAITAFSYVYDFISQVGDSVLLAHNLFFEMTTLHNLCSHCDYPSTYIDHVFGHKVINLQSLLLSLGEVYRTDSLDYTSLNSLLDTFAPEHKEVRSKSEKQFRVYEGIINTMRSDFYKCDDCGSTTLDEKGNCFICSGK
jgi:hypothetical protein